VTPLVSVLLTSWNRAAMLDKAVTSVLTQTMDDYELLILDDNSDDPRTAGVIVRYWNTPQVQIYKSAVRPEERGQRVRYAAQINTGLKFAAGKYVTYLCDDDWYYPDRLERMTAVLEGRNPATVCYGSQHMINAAGEIIGIRPAAGVLGKASGVVDHSSVMHRTETAALVGGWPDDRSLWNMADAYFWDRLTAAGHMFYPVPGPPTDAHLYHPGDSQSWGPLLYGAAG
jgi:spore maturation protein CgeD